jgi:phage terminase large subunit-like protein
MARRDAATDYAREVVDGRVVAGELVRLACQRHLRDIDNGRERGLVWNAHRASAAVQFFTLLRHIKGPKGGKPIVLEPWQKFFVGAIYGWTRTNGTRRFREAFLEVGRKNGKTAIASGIGIAELVMTGEHGPEVYTLATKRDQARLTHADSLRMVQKSPGLRKWIKVYKDSLINERMSGKYVPLSADAHTLDGLNPSAAIMDEIHEWPSRLLYDVIETGMGARSQPLILITTTAGFDRHSIWWERREAHIAALRGQHEDDSLFAYIATLDKDDDWTDPSVWVKANPNLGVTIDPEEFARKVRQAQAIPGKQNSFKRKNLNMPTDAASLWISREAWDRCAGLTDVAQLAGRSCYVGVDLSTKRDLTAAVYVFPPEDEGGVWCLVPRFWLPEEDLAERCEQDGVPYDRWAESGHISLIPGRIVDYDVVRQDLMADAEDFDVLAFVFDPWGAVQTMKRLDADGYVVRPFRQTERMYKAPVLEFEGLIEQRRILHTGCPVLGWCVANTALEETRAGNRTPSKSSSTTRIDGTVAALMAIGAAIEAEQEGDVGSLEL